MAVIVSVLLVTLEKFIAKSKPSIIFHLAAQSLVKKSFKYPVLTWKSNVNTTINLLESLRHVKKKTTVIIVTSDKCYLPQYKSFFNENRCSRV